ncbi:hypothetical protein [Paenibacillus sp. YAF4_2]|uniref:hypothetical protein n=1 Tax=Paenibacillus sp. YAF4_2 TaxID=3233085 RepID=UPI003F9C4ABE
MKFVSLPWACKSFFRQSKIQRPQIVNAFKTAPELALNVTRDYWHIRHFNKKRRALPFAACKSLFSAVGIAKSIGEITIF